MTGFVIVQAQDDFLQLGLRSQQVLDGGCAHPAQSHIGVILPSLRVQGNVGHQIDGSFKGVQFPAGTWPVEAVLFFAAR